jgi:hypothetical protein
MTTMIVCDDERFIRYYLAGFPGCVHDNRVYKNTELYRDPEKFFGSSYFLLSDSALTNSRTVVSSFKCASGHSLPPDRERFNKILAKPRVISEHTIGMLKGRFQFLKSMPMKITEQKKSVKKILRIIDCCVIIHNFLLKVGDDELPNDWVEEEESDDESDDDASDVGHEVGEYFLSVDENDEDDSRRQVCMEYLKDMNMI